MDTSAPLLPQEYERLLGYLPEQLAQQLRVEGSLSPAALAEASVLLRRELASLVAFVPYPLVRKQLMRPEPGRVSGSYWRGSMLFADLSGFTALSEQLSVLGKQGAEEVSAIINGLFGALVDDAHTYWGALLKFGGDALTVFFDEELLGANHAALAAAAAKAMQQRMVGFAAVETRVGRFNLRLRVGVHSGQIFAAEVGDRSHIELVISGRTVNQVALAQEVAEPGEVVVTDATLALLGGAGGLEVRSQERREGFHLLQSMAGVSLPSARPPVLGEAGRASHGSLLLLGEQAEALRPYLMHGLPRRFLNLGELTELGEFRPVSVLFANFYPFSSMLEALGEQTELAAQVLNAYYQRAQAVVHGYGGIVNKVDMYTSGDKLMALFGAPIAHEDDPLRATRAALDLSNALNEANVEIVSIMQRAAGSGQRAEQIGGLKQRIGLNTGQVFAGRVGSVERHEYTVMGPAVNLAARLMSSGEEGNLVISPSTRRVVERLIAVRELPPIRLKGLAEPVTPALALHAYAVERNVPGASSGAGLQQAALVARDSELRQGLEQGRAALRGAGRVLALVGDAGTGKTRLMQELLQRLMLESLQSEDRLPAFNVYSADCQSYEQRTPYAVARPLLRQLLGLESVPNSGDGTGIELLVYQRVLALAPDLERFTPLLADMLAQPLGETVLTSGLSPVQRHDRGQELVEALLRGVLQRQPLVLVVDDLHWADASSHELLARLAGSSTDLPLLLLLCYRRDPPVPEPWQELPGTLQLLLSELPAAGGRALAAALLGGNLPSELLPLLEQTQGNPFFIEEMLRGLIATGALDRRQKAGVKRQSEERDRYTSSSESQQPDTSLLFPDSSEWHLARPLSDVALPDSIEGLLTARLDRLDDGGRDLAQAASVIGRRFVRPLLSGVYAGAAPLDSELLRLTEAEIFVRDDNERWLALTSSLYACVFRHTLVRDVAYESILYARRRELHRRVARRIAAVYGPQASEQLPLLARHYLLAEEWLLAFQYHLEAGRQAQSRYANTEALALLAQALEIGARLELRAGAQELVERAGQALNEQKEQIAGSPFEIGAAVVELHERIGSIHTLIGEHDLALVDFQQALALVNSSAAPDSQSVVRLHRQIATTYERQADFESAASWLDRGMAQASAGAELELCRCYLLGSGIYQRQGKYQQCLEWGRTGLVLAEELGSLGDQAKAYKLLGGTYGKLGDIARAVDLGKRSLELYIGLEDVQEQAGVHNNLGIILHDQGRWVEARSHFESGAALAAAIGNTHEQAMIANNLGDLLRGLGDADGAITQYQVALTGWRRSLYGSGVVTMNLGAAYLQRDDLDLAKEQLDHSEALFKQAGVEDFMPELLRYRAELALRCGDPHAALATCAAALETATRLGARLEEGGIRRVIGHALAQQGDQQRAWEELQASLLLLEEADSPLEIARTLLEIADIAPQLQRQSEGQAALERALTTLNSLGARRDLERAQEIGERWGYR